MNHTTNPLSLREAIRRTLAKADGFAYEGLEPHDYQRHADALLALLPASLPSAVVSADRATLLAEVATALIGRHCSPESIAVVRRLVDERLCTTCQAYGQTVEDTTDGGIVWRCKDCNGEGMRRAAAEEQPTETQAHPPEHTWAAELHDPLVEEWVPGTRYTDRDRAVNALAHAKRLGPTWKDGTPAERRLVRATTTYTVEAEYTPPAVAEQPDTQTREAGRG